jgi:Replication-relaxation
MTSSRITAARTALVEELLGDRDTQIIQALARVRVATVRQLQRLFFVTTSPLSSSRQCQKTLERLSAWRVVTRLERRVGGARSGSAGFIYALDTLGQRVVGRAGPVGGSRPRRAWTPSRPFLRHALAVSELYVRLVEVARMAPFVIEAFDAEPGSWRAFTGSAGEVVFLKPDAFIRLGADEFTHSTFVEVDCGTESRTALAVKFDRYRLYWASGAEQRRHGVFPRVLWLVPERKRYQQVLDAASRQPAESWRLFRVALYDEAIHALVGDGDG